MTIVKYHHHFVRCSKTFVNQTRVMDNSIDGLMSVRTLVENILLAAWSSRLLAGSSSLASVPGWMSHSIVGIWLWLSLVRDLYDNWSQQESPRLWPLSPGPGLWLVSLARRSLSLAAQSTCGHHDILHSEGEIKLGLIGFIGWWGQSWDKSSGQRVCWLYQWHSLVKDWEIKFGIFGNDWLCDTTLDYLIWDETNLIRSYHLSKFLEKLFRQFKNWFYRTFWASSPDRSADIVSSFIVFWSPLWPIKIIVKLCRGFKSAEGCRGGGLAQPLKTGPGSCVL